MEKCAPVDGDQEMAPAEVAAGAASVELAADADQEMAPVDVAAGADPANNQDPEADGGLNDGLAPLYFFLPFLMTDGDSVTINNLRDSANGTFVTLDDYLPLTDPVAPPMSVGRRQPNEPTEAERLAHNRTHNPYADWCESCVRGRGRDDPHRARQDHVEGNPSTSRSMRLIASSKQRRRTSCAMQSAQFDTVYNRTMALECEFKGLSDQAVPKHLREYLKSLRVRKGSGARRPRRSSQQSVGPRNRWTVRVDTETVTFQGQTSAWACGTIPCDPRRTDAYLEKRCSEEVRCTFASTPSDSGMARQTLCVVAWSVCDEATRSTNTFPEADGQRLPWCRHPHF